MADPIRGDEREQDDPRLRLLEELWAAPAVPEARPRRTSAWFSRRFGRILAAAWLAFVGSLFLTPAPDPELVVPLWADSLVAAFFLVLTTAGIMAALRTGRSAYATATAAGVLGLGAAVGCGVTGHHPSAWWIYELVASGALAALAATRLVRRR